jgi:23S rRNA pseudouridine1911/1915/1917 synthase
MSELDILYEDNHLLVVNKPTGIATMGSDDGATIHQLACRYIGQKYNKPGKVFLGIVHRLDSMSSGVLVLARTSKAAARLSDQFRRTIDGPHKIYVATVEGDVVEPRGRFRDWIFKNEQTHKMEAASSSTPGAVEAELDYRVLRRATGTGLKATLIAVRLLTGRKHQIRVQFSERGHAVLGDIKYGAAQRSMRGIGLHAWSLTINHPTKGEPMTFHAPTPSSWGQWQPRPEELNELDKPSAW